MIISAFGVYHFVVDTIEEYQTGSISMVVESLQPLDNSIFPTIAVCEMGYTKDDYDFLNDLAEEYWIFVVLHLLLHLELICDFTFVGPHRVTDGTEDDENLGDVYDFLMRIVYFNLYAINTYQSYCKKYEGKEGMAPCPQDDYVNISQRVLD